MAAGVPSLSLMVAAGTASAAVLLRDHADRLAQGVAVFAGSGNNGGDAYIVAAQLARAGVRVRIVAAAPPRTDDAREAAAIAERYRGRLLSIGEPTGRERLVVDGLLGTGHRGEIREPIISCCAAIRALRAHGATIAALDVPSGLDASTGECAVASVPAHLTLSYGTVKRGLLIARAHAGRILLLDIGLGEQARGHDEAWEVADSVWLSSHLPAIAWNAHKGQRGHLAVIGGITGMVGAVVLATRSALASGVGLARAFVDESGVAVLQSTVPQAIADSWSRYDTSDQVRYNAPARDAMSVAATSIRADALVIGPGLGRDVRSRDVLRAALDAHPEVPVVLDADALTMVAHDATDTAERLREWCGPTRAVVCTPHPLEFARLIGRAIAVDWQSRGDLLREFAERAHATVLLKGTPTLIATPGRTAVTAAPHGSAVLATGGSGDLLAGVIGALLAQGVDAHGAALLGATAHGVAAELVATREVRGYTLDDVLRALPMAWTRMAQPVTLAPGVLAEWPAVAGMT